jgi:hypothetical protein
MNAVLDFNSKPGRKAKTIPVNGGSYRNLWLSKYEEAKANGLIDVLEPWMKTVASRRGIMRKVHKTQGGVITLPKAGTFRHDALNEYRGQMVEVRYDPANLHDPCVVLKDGKHICDAIIHEARGFMSTVDAREDAKLERRRQKLHRELGEVSRQKDVLEAAKSLYVTGDELRSMDQETELLQAESKKHRAAIKAAQAAERDEFETAIAVTVERMHYAPVKQNDDPAALYWGTAV